MTNRKFGYWVIPPEADGEFVAHMEVVLDTYAQQYAERFRVLCMDEQLVKLLNEARLPLPATKTQPRRVDNEHERAGTASFFMFCEPFGRLASGHRAGASDQDRLGMGGVGTLAWPLCEGGESDRGARQSEHAHGPVRHAMRGDRSQ